MTTHFSREEMIELCLAHAQSVFREGCRKINPFLPQMTSDWSAWEEAEAAINKAAQCGDLPGTIKLCDGYLRRIDATVQKWTAATSQIAKPKPSGSKKSVLLTT